MARTPNEKKINNQSRRPSRPRPDQDRSTGLDNCSPAVQDQAVRLTGSVGDAGQAATILPEFVRDVLYSAEDFKRLENYRASRVLATGQGYCVAKAGLLAAPCWAAHIPARVAFADVRNHLASSRLRAAMGADVFACHGHTEILLGRRWVNVSPTFDKAMCQRVGVPALDFDGKHDALLPAFDGGGHMEYVKFHGAYHDVAARFLAAEIPRLYPFVRNGDLQRFKDRP